MHAVRTAPGSQPAVSHRKGGTTPEHTPHSVLDKPYLSSWYAKTSEARIMTPEVYKIIRSYVYEGISHVSGFSGVAMRAIFKWRVKRKIELYLFPISWLFGVIHMLGRDTDFTALIAIRLYDHKSVVSSPAFKPHGRQLRTRVDSLTSVNTKQRQHTDFFQKKVSDRAVRARACPHSALTLAQTWHVGTPAHTGLQ